LQIFRGIHLQRSPKFEHRCCHFEQYLAARPHFHDVIPQRDFVQMASDKPFNYHSRLWLLMSHIILTQTCSKLGNESVEDSEVDNHLEKIHFAGLAKEAKSVVGFSPSCQFRVGCINTVWLPRQFQNGSLQSHFFQDEFL